MMNLILADLSESSVKSGLYHTVNVNLSCNFIYTYILHTYCLRYKYPKRYISEVLLLIHTTAFLRPIHPQIISSVYIRSLALLTVSNG
ncbi:hypothetical protein AQUCO_00900522v1 [Aquilegia coerulea]|uniref:Uncharacterized protein n=1 Tax=Aquilegia coerulea TaxID=218851 RepID=A0A2G5EE33_AQUCA|nr:hypothetical protein AQUCO_00900522v1 [Aquilegia coerulea]